MSDPPPNGPGPAARIDQMVAQAKAKAERYQAMQAAAGQVSVTETGEDGLVAVTVDSAGNLTDLRISDRVRELSGDRIAAAATLTREARPRQTETHKIDGTTHLGGSGGRSPSGRGLGVAPPENTTRRAGPRSVRA
ncbi:YbaB/EbfC family nucleoid-associated protein [Amycolatopsis rubida]|uniref:YbaB/EbfC family nucleoid-associated protein n=1 Tax=Amycolatopsis rubida TaxID=112413 RepID=A0ABX0BGT5_9PSEU|nr:MULTISPECIES: YbaB/EbfC family nucleoid-associated protein [Amycolatopsis]MYW89462.1 hypothetical protein [Amycolatopsis rubida]NEC54439.1 YbaB/EbfC family nucleoid-associated protein [Amycolatopsis rubida]OAP20487.1 Nucleoid-associated protein YbaB [Amycolatopsis sp. M39]